MFKVTRLLWLTLLASAWPFSALSAQTYEVNVSGITFVNTNLDPDCSRTMIYQNLLSGDFDVDGDGMVPPQSAFAIEIDDLDPDNGHLLDGCGSFDFTVTPAPGSGLTGFISAFGTINASDVTPPTQLLTALPNGPFSTTRLADLTINTLPPSVSRTFVVDGGNSFPLMNSLDPALMTRLLAGGDIPRFMDSCSDVEVTVSDAVTMNGDCGDVFITRTFTARDYSADCNLEDEPGNGERVVSYNIVLERPSGTDVQGPPAVVNFECTDPSVTDGVFPRPSTFDFPFLHTPDGPVFLTSPFGNVGASFSDSEAVQTCDDTYKFVRTYTVIDWCDPGNVRTFAQLVKVGDTNAPTITAPVQDLNFDGVADDGPLVYSTNAPGCGAFVPTGTGGLLIEDGCGSVVSTTAFVLMDRDTNTIVGPIDVNAANPTERLTPFLPVGPHTLRYVAADACGNESTLDIDLVIEDRSGPVVIAENALNVSLSNNGFAEVPATDVDRGSYDDCTDVTLEIAFANPSSMLAIGSFAPTLTLTCIDVGAVPVILRVTDGNGNANQRMSIINVVDNSAPICIAPGGMNLDCTTADDLLPEDLNGEFATSPVGTIALLDQLFGTPTSLDNCGNELVSQTVVSNVNDCGQGTVTRSFSVTDARGFVSAPGCDQVITIGGIRDYTIVFPADAESTCGVDPTINEVRVEENGCDLLVHTMQTDTFFADAAECFKLRRTIEVLNWCEYNGIDAAYTIRRDADGDGNFNEPTYLHVLPADNADPDDDRAVLDVDGDRTNNNDIGPLDVDDNFGFNVDSDNDGDTGFARSLSRGYYRYVQFIKVYDNVAPTITNVESRVTPGANCADAGVRISYAVLDDCVQDNVRTQAAIDFNYVAANGFNSDRGVTNGELSGSGMTGFTVDLDGVPAGQHALRISGFDGCGNTDGRIVPFTVGAGGSIAPICIGRLTFTLMPDGEGGGLAVVEADDYVIDVNGNCNDAPVQYSVYREESEAGVPGFVPRPDRPSFPVTCDDTDTLMLRVYTFAANGSDDFCTVQAIIRPFNDNVCPGGGLGSLAGFVTSPFNDLLSDIEIHLTNSGTMDEMQYTDENGSFLFPGLEEGGEYMIRPAMGDRVDLQRVKTSDINRIMHHVMGVNPLTNPYLLVAADVDADGYVTVGDMVAIRRVILGLDATYPDGPTYRFIQRDFGLDGLAEGWDPTIFPSTFTVEELAGHNREADFVAVAVGDVFIEAAGRQSVDLTAADRALAAGASYELHLTAGQLSGLQGTFEAAPGLRITGWSSDYLGGGHVNESLLNRGLLAVSYDDRTVLTGEEILTLRLRAERDLRISDYLSVTDRVAGSEAITAAGTAARLGLSFSEPPGGASIMLHQNFPNPVAARTTIAFELPAAATASLAVRDVAGRLLHQRTFPASAGRNTLTLTNDDLKNTTGLLSYTLTVGEHRLTKRMTVVAR